VLQADEETPVAETDAIAWGFLSSEYAGDHFASWPIERRLDGYLLHQGLSNIADDGTRCAALMDQVMADIASARGNETLLKQPDAGRK
jgi:hypothetical protein